MLTIDGDAEAERRWRHDLSRGAFQGYLVRRFVHDRPSFERLRDVLGLMALGAAVAPMIAASIGATTLLLTHVRAWSGFSTAWQVWWLGDAMGVLIVTPMFFLTRRGLIRSFRTHIIEPLALLVGLVAICHAIFGGPLGLRIKDDALAFLAFPFVIWAAIRFRTFGAAIATFLIAAISGWGTAHGNGPFAKHNPLHFDAESAFAVSECHTDRLRTSRGIRAMAPNSNELRNRLRKSRSNKDHNEFTALVQELNRLLDAEQSVEKPPKAEHLTMHSAKI